MEGLLIFFGMIAVFAGIIYATQFAVYRWKEIESQLPHNNPSPRAKKIRRVKVRVRENVQYQAKSSMPIFTAHLTEEGIGLTVDDKIFEKMFKPVFIGWAKVTEIANPIVFGHESLFCIVNTTPILEVIFSPSDKNVLHQFSGKTAIAEEVNPMEILNKIKDKS